MNHARVFLVSAIVSALAACGGGGEDGSSDVSSPSSVNGAGAASNAASAANGSAAASPDVMATVNGQTLSATQAAVVQANESAAAAQRQAEEAQARLAAERAEAEEARLQAAEAAERAAAAEAQNRAAAEQAAREAAARNEALQQRLNDAEAQARQAQEAARAQAAQLAQAEDKLAEAARQAGQQQAAAPAASSAIPDCSQNPAAVDDPETGLKLVCESQIRTGETTADVGTAKHASGRYYALPFPDTTMVFAGRKASYKMACFTTTCEWKKEDGPIDIEYAAQGMDGNYYRFTRCRKGRSDQAVCSYPSTGRPDGTGGLDDQHPEPPRAGAAITDTDTSGWRDFRASAAFGAPAGCNYGETVRDRGYAYELTDIVIPWPDKSLFRQEKGGGWVAVFDGGNCLGDVRVDAGSGPEAPSSPVQALFWASATDWRFQVAGPDGTLMEPVMKFPVIRSYDSLLNFQETLKENPTARYTSMIFSPGRKNDATSGSAGGAGGHAGPAGQ